MASKGDDRALPYARTLAEGGGKVDYDDEEAMPRPLRQQQPDEPIDLAERRSTKDGRPPESATASNRAERLLALIAERWRGHEPEVAVLAAITSILAAAAIFSGADVFFSVTLVVAAGITIWSPWRAGK